MSRKNLYDSISVTINSSLLLGLFPMYIGQNGQKKLVKTNKLCNLPILANIVIYTIILLLTSHLPNPIVQSTIYNFNTLAKLMITIAIAVCVTSTYVIYFYSYKFKNSVVHVLNKFALVEKSLSQFGYKFQYKLGFILNLLISASGVLFIMLIAILELWNVSRENLFPISWIVMFSLVFPFILIHHGESQFILFNIMCYKRFEAINVLLKRLKKNLVKEHKLRGKGVTLFGGISGVGNGREYEKLVTECLRCHGTLCDLCRALNTMYGFIIVAGCLVQFNTAAFALCYIYYNITARPVSSLGWALWVTLRIYEVFRKSFFAHINVKEARSTIQCVNNLFTSSFSENFEEKLRIFYLQLGHCKFDFTALELFPINGSFAFAFVSAVSIYITIIYQFQYNKPLC